MVKALVMLHYLYATVTCMKCRLYYDMSKNYVTEFNWTQTTSKISWNFDKFESAVMRNDHYFKWC